MMEKGDKEAIIKEDELVLCHQRHRRSPGWRQIRQWRRYWGVCENCQMHRINARIHQSFSISFTNFNPKVYFLYFCCKQQSIVKYLLLLLLFA